MQTARLLRHLLATVGLMVAVNAMAALNPVTGVSLTTALNDAYALTTGTPDLKVVRVEGESMLPYFGSGAVLIVKAATAARLQAGMVVVYTNRFSETVAHSIVGGNSTEGWVVKGFNNAAADSTRVTDANLMGVVYGTFHSDAAPANAGLLSSVVASTPVALAAPAR